MKPDNFKKTKEKLETKNILLQMADHAIRVGKKVSYAKDVNKILYDKQ